MSINYNRARFNKYKNNYKKSQTILRYPIGWDLIKRHYKCSTKGKIITKVKYREYRTWKYNRKTQFK